MAALIGCGGRGFGLLPIHDDPGCTLAAVCDVDLQHVAAAKNRIGKCDGYQDLRPILDRKDIDAVLIATPDHWHAAITIMACQAGKDVYCEKPLSHFIWEGRQMVNAARKYNRLVQCGVQQRSRQSTKDAIAWIRAGNLGKILYITCFANKPRVSCGKRTTPLEIPDYVDYDLWCGPARKEPIFRDRLQYDCSFTWNMGDGESCNQGVHEIDVARWILGYDTLPRRTMSLGGRFVVNDAGEVPNTQIIYYDYPGIPILYELHNLPKVTAFFASLGIPLPGLNAPFVAVLGRALARRMWGAKNPIGKRLADRDRPGEVAVEEVDAVKSTQSVRAGGAAWGHAQGSESVCWRGAAGSGSAPAASPPRDRSPLLRIRLTPRHLRTSMRFIAPFEDLWIDTIQPAARNMRGKPIPNRLRGESLHPGQPPGRSDRSGQASRARTLHPGRKKRRR